MTERLPEYLKQGEVSRLFPVLSTTSKEGRTTSILLACIERIDELGAELLGSLGQRVGTRSKVTTYTEICFRNTAANLKDRPDGLIIVEVGKRQWRALVEAKVGSSQLTSEQIERYRALAKDNQVDCVISISNQFATDPTSHPIEDVRKSRSKIPVFHWSWMHILTVVDLLLSRGEVSDSDQKALLNELRRFLSHESAGVKGFDRMPSEWSDLNRLISSGGTIPAKSHEATTVLQAWHQETRDLSLILSRLTETAVTERMPRKHKGDPGKRLQEEYAQLRESNQLACTLDVPGAAAPVEVVCDIMRRSIDVGMTLKSPTDKKSTKARLNWLLKQLPTEKTEDIHVRLLWPGKSEATQFPISDLRSNVEIAHEGKEHLTPHSFQVVLSRRTSGRFTQQTNFISDLEDIVPKFYGSVGENIRAWSAPAPKIKHSSDSPEEVSTEAIAEGAEDYER